MFGIFTMTWIWSMVFDSPMFQIFVLYIDFECAKNIIYVLLVLILGFGGLWRFLIGVWNLDLDMVTGLYSVLVYLDFESAKNINIL